MHFSTARLSSSNTTIILEADLMWIFPESDYNIFSHYKGNSSHDLQLKYNNLVIIFTHNHEKKSI